MRKAVSLRVKAASGLLLAGFGSALFARERDPLPTPMPCPIVAPVRVASVDTLARFQSLSNCAPAAVIVSPYEGRTEQRAPVRVAPESETGGVAAVFAASAGRAKPQSVPTKVEQANVGTNALRVVRIAPPADAFVDDTLAPEVASGGAGIVSAAALAPAAVTPAVVSDAFVLSLRPLSYTTPYDTLIANAAIRHGIDPLMLHSVISQESRYRVNAFSPAGARGLMQIMPATGARFGVGDPAALFDPAINIDTGARLLKQLWGRLNGRFDLVLAAYNAGEGAVQRYSYQVPPYRETLNYVARVQSVYRQLAANNGITQ